MPSLVLTVGQDGKFCGLTHEDQVQFKRWCNRAKEMKPGETLSFTYEIPRSQKMHSRYFVALQQIWENQEVFRSVDELRVWAEQGAGHVERLNVEGVTVERVKSISYDELDDDPFFVLFSKVKAFILSHKGLRKLWPHSPTGAAYEAAHHILEHGL